MSENDTLLSERRGPIGVVTFNRPDRRNALSPAMLIRLHETLEAWAREDEIRVVVVTGSGQRAFSSGFDILAIPTDLTPELARQLRDSNPLELGLSSVKHFPYPTIAMLNGYCFGGALHLALCCDLRIGVDDIVVGMPAARLGLVYAPDGIAQFVQVLGMARAREVLFTARSYRGQDAQSMGLVERLVPRAELERTTFKLAEEIAANAPLALRGIKQILNRIEASAPLSAEARSEADALVAAALGSEDAKEAQKAFVEKRPARFVGR
jgi:enoyl-CoA hydratase/carnithine racemase